MVMMGHPLLDFWRGYLIKGKAFLTEKIIAFVP
jgi:hypothetical protein